MKCPKCGNELEEGKLLCEQCGEEIKIVPDFDIELEAQMDETISNIVENISVTVSRLQKRMNLRRQKLMSRKMQMI